MAREFWANLLPFAFVATLVGACYLVPRVFFGSLLSGLDCPEGQVSEELYERLTRSRLPASARIMETAQGGQDDKYCEAYFRLELDSADLEKWIASTRISSSLTRVSGLTAFATFHHQIPWQPDPLVSYLYGRGPISLDYTQQVYVDTRNPERYIAYFIVEYESI